MIALEVELLTGRYVATCFNNRSAPEWPPHPARLFSALVATAHEHEELTEPARIALQWLERQGAPHIEASAAETRSLIASYVPGNEGGVVGGWQAAEEKLDEALAELAQAEASGDAKAKKSAQRHVDKARKKFEADLGTALVDDGKGNALDAQRQLPDKRGRQARLMPALTPHVPCVRYAWPHADPSTEVVVQLKELSRRLVRLGHSSSFVSCRVLDEVATLQSPSYRSSARPGSGLQHWRPTSSSGVSMRIVDSGQLRRLESAFERHGGFEPRILPYAYQSYEIEGAEGTYTPAASAYGEWIVLREVAGESGRRLGLKLSKTEDITRALRGALLIHSEGAIPPVISGHDSSGKPLERPHVAYVPLADVGSEYSSGNVLGVAVLLPRSIDQAERRAVLRAIGRWEQAGLRLTLGRVGALELERVVDIDPRKTLDPKWWTLPARRWGSVTPVALDRNPGNLHSSDPKEASIAARSAEEIVMKACERIGLPSPRWVEIIRRSLFDATPAARQYMPFPKKSSQGKAFSRVCVHIEMCFEEPVMGPVLIGAGRYFGVGLCRGRE